MNFHALNFGDGNILLSYILSIVFVLGIDVLLFFVIKRKFPIIFIITAELLGFLALAFALYTLSFLLFLTLTAGIILFLFSNLNEFRHIVGNQVSKGGFLFFKGHKKPLPEKIFDREALYEKVYRTVLDMSRLKRGALITFMKKDNILDDSKLGTVIRQKGVTINAPFTPELVETIFYEGTRLHDGAIVVKDDIIVRASVFFVSTERPLTGKYGSRHQAAIGISENSDAVTIVVSEETGRVAIAFQGELTPVNADNFLRVFEDDMAYETVRKTKQ